MAFVRKKVKTFKWPVKVKEPSADRPGEFDTFEFVALFKRVKLSEIEQMGDDAGLPLLKKVLVGWEALRTRMARLCRFPPKSLSCLLMTWIG